MPQPLREVGSMMTSDDDLIYMATKVKKAKSIQAKIRAIKQLELLISTARITAEQQLKKERGQQ